MQMQQVGSDGGTDRHGYAEPGRDGDQQEARLSPVDGSIAATSAGHGYAISTSLTLTGAERMSAQI